MKNLLEKIFTIAINKAQTQILVVGRTPISTKIDFIIPCVQLVETYTDLASMIKKYDRVRNRFIFNNGSVIEFKTSPTHEGLRGFRSDYTILQRGVPEDIKQLCISRNLIEYWVI